MPALVAGIHVFTDSQQSKSWMARTSPAMTMKIRRSARRLLRLYYRHVGFNRIGDKTILVGGGMHFIELLRARYSVPAPRNLRAQLDPSDRHLSIGVFFHVP